MARSVVDATKVGFSAGARAFWGPVGTPENLLNPLGLIGADATLNISQTTRQKFDGQPRLLVKQAIDQQSAQIQLVMHEMTVDNLSLALGLEASDLIASAPGDVVVTNESVTLDANNVAALQNPVKLVGGVPTPAPVVTNVGGSTTYVAGTDYILVPRDPFGRTLIYRLASGAIAAGQTLEVDYTWVRQGRVEFPIGTRSTLVERKIKIEEEWTDGRRLIAIFPRALISINGNITLNTSGENGMSIPITIDGLYDSSINRLVSVYLDTP
ncbi:MAG: hypothetical protein KatS3mg051_1554 [Anaerolineae bacterium]|nr:MAG: hypothetical protein KatS3mg051_1554 [Anaerolineae bacterium]